eukprot:9755572-Alexandrium_andersonii.AAC.1
MCRRRQWGVLGGASPRGEAGRKTARSRCSFLQTVCSIVARVPVHCRRWLEALLLISQRNKDGALRALRQQACGVATVSL